MIDDACKEAEQLSELANFDARSLSPLQKDIWAEAWLAGRESVCAEIVTCPACASSWSQGEGRDKAIEAERERSQRLIETLRLRAEQSWVPENFIFKSAADCIEAFPEQPAAMVHK